jgi:acyl-CoA synthetase (AMP-forming)/AMP-acid ligase II
LSTAGHFKTFCAFVYSSDVPIQLRPTTISIMIRDAHSVVQALIGCLITWASTAAGAAAVFLPCRSTNHKLSGVLVAAAG